MLESDLSRGSVAGAILAGGRGERIGGAKPLVALAGYPLIEHVAATLRPAVSNLAVVGNSRAAAVIDAQVLEDKTKDATGPLAGILSALEWAADQGAGWLVIVPCDTPLLPQGVVPRLLEGAMAAEAMLACAATPDGLQPLVSIWRVELAASVRAAIGRTHPPVHELMARLGAAHVRFEDESAFLNVNTPADLAAAEKLLGSRNRGPK